MSAPVRDHVEAAGLVGVPLGILYHLTSRPGGLLVKSLKNAVIGAAASGAITAGTSCVFDALDEDDDLLEHTVGIGVLGSIFGGLVGFAGTLTWEALTR